MNKLLVVVFALFTVLWLSACNTVQGVGKDISKAGEVIEDAAKKK
jgi:predicted small secreted protein